MEGPNYYIVERDVLNDVRSPSENSLCKTLPGQSN
jgi:hypothetical protein